MVDRPKDPRLKTYVQINICISSIFRIAEITVAVYALVQVASMRDAWDDIAPREALVLTGQLPGFWGPVHLIVPTSCSYYGNETALQGHRIDRLDERIEVENCGAVFDVEEVTDAQSYLSVAYFGVPETMDELRASRHNIFHILIFISVLELIAQFITRVFGPWYQCKYEEEHKEGEVTAFQSAEEGDEDETKATLVSKMGLWAATMLKLAVELFAFMVAQLQVLSAFYMFWNQDALVMPLLTRRAYTLLVISYPILIVLFTMLAVYWLKYEPPVERLAGLCCPMCCYICFLLVGVVIPTCYGQTLYCLNFLWNAGVPADAGMSSGPWAASHSSEWPDHLLAMQRAGKAVVGCRLAEFATRALFVLVAVARLE